MDELTLNDAAETEWFKKFAVNLPFDIELCQFQKIDDYTVSWHLDRSIRKNDMPLVYIYITLRFNISQSGQRYPVFEMQIKSGNKSVPYCHIANSPTKCLFDLNKKLKEARLYMQDVHDIWSKYGF